jgi:phosphoenolpyruvate-protein phosphotransferase
VAVAPAWRYVDDGARPPGPSTEPSHDPRTALEESGREAARQLDVLAERLRAAGRADEAGILEAQAMMATDPTLIGAAVDRARAGEDPRAAIAAAAAASAETIAAVDDPLLAARAADVRDVGARIARILSGSTLDLPTVPSIAIASDLPPSVTAEVPRGRLVGIALEGGSPTAHAAILARGLGIPAVVGVVGLIGALEDELSAADGPVEVALDGDRGEVFLRPRADVRVELAARTAAATSRRDRAAGLRGRPGATADGQPVALLANIGTPDDADRALAFGAEGVGLFRTEFLFMGRPAAPSEEEQVEAYRTVFEAFGSERPVVVRLADIGGDKAIPYLDLPAETNPFLGVRAIRIAYRSPELLLTQLRAISRSGALAGVLPHVMAPMVATRADVALFLSLRDEAQARLAAESLPHAARLVCGIMIEVPSAVFLARELAREVEFFSIGTNDLTQYLFAADRTNAELTRYHDALHPAVLRAIAEIVAAAHGSAIPVAVCGELAGDPAGALVLVGLGVDELSADAGSLDDVRFALAGATRSELDELARTGLAAGDAATVRRLAGEVRERTRARAGATETNR